MLNLSPAWPIEPTMDEPADAVEPHHPPQSVSAHKAPLPRLTKRVFTDLAIWMIGLGLVMGLAFPLFAVALGVPSRFVLTPSFFTATVVAGLVVGWANQFLSRIVVRARLRFMGSKMIEVERMLREGMLTGDVAGCTPEKCTIPVDSDDELGEVAVSFNHLVDALAASHAAGGLARRFTTTLSSHIELRALVKAALADLCERGRYEAAAVCLLDEDELVTVASVGVTEPSRLASSELVQRSFSNLETVVFDISEDLEIDAGLLRFRPRSVIAHSLHVRMVPIGVVVLASPRPVLESDVLLMEQLAPSFAIALNNALSHERLQELAAIDSLTGLLNRRFGLERLSQEFSRAVRSGDPLGVVLFDIDHFKVVNDAYGHQAGDKVLKAVAEAVTGVLREGDVLMRYGGEEFMAVLPGAGESDVESLGERIRRVVEACTVTQGPMTVRVTVSLGAASFPSVDVTDTDDLIRLADEAMYVAKQAGRNRLEFARC